MSTTLSPATAPATTPAPAPMATPVATPHTIGYPAANTAVRRSLGSAGTRQPKGGVVTQLATEKGEAVNVEVEVGGVTGTWRWDAKKKRHEIRLGDRFIEALIPGAVGTRSASGRERVGAIFGEQILRHEAWHGRVTDKDLKGIADYARMRVVPFLLVNLFEDMRLEELARKIEGQNFNWWRFMRREHVHCPLSAIVAMVHSEWSESCSFSPAGVVGFDPAKVKAARDKVTEFANRVKAAPNTKAVVDIAAEWVDYWRHSADFPLENHGTGNKGGVHGGDGIGGESDGSLTKAQEEAKKRDAVVHGRSMGAKWDDTKDRTRVRVVPFLTSFAMHGSRFNSRDADEMANALRGIIARSASPRSARASTSGSRLYIPGIAAQRDQAFRARGKTGGKPHLTMLIDYSGSMSGDWHQHGLLFTAALLRLLRQGVVTGKLYATGGGFLAEIPASTTDAQLASTCPSKSCENVRDSLLHLSRECEASDAVVIYTDGELTDGHVDAGEWRRRGVNLLGACVIPETWPEYMREEKTTEMTRLFGRSVLGENGKVLAKKLAQKLGEAMR